MIFVIIIEIINLNQSSDFQDIRLSCNISITHVNYDQYERLIILLQDNYIINSIRGIYCPDNKRIYNT